MASVQLQVDGSSAGSADRSSPYSFSLNTANYTNGSHALVAVAKDTAGNSATSTAGNVTVSNQSTSSGTLGWSDITNQQLSGNCPPSNYGSHGYNFASNCNGVVDAGRVELPIQPGTGCGSGVAGIRTTPETRSIITI